MYSSSTARRCTNAQRGWRAVFRRTRWNGAIKKGNLPWVILSGTSRPSNVTCLRRPLLGGRVVTRDAAARSWPMAGSGFAFCDKLHAESLEIFSRLTPEQLRGKCVTPDGASITVWKWLRSMVEHEIHHRGQIYLYLAMLGVPTPPLYGLTAE